MRFPDATLAQCEATTEKGRQCQRRGRYDGYHGLVLCEPHLAAYERTLVATRGSAASALSPAIHRRKVMGSA